MTEMQTLPRNYCGGPRDMKYEELIMWIEALWRVKDIIGQVTESTSLQTT